MLSRAALREFPQPMVDLGFNKRCFVLFSSSRLAWCSVYRTVACVAYASLTGSDKANPLTPALLVQLGISLSPGQQYIIHSEYLSHIWKRQQRKKKKEDRQRSGDESPNNIYLRKNPSGLHLIDLISATSGRLFKGKGWGRESITERVETTLAPTMSTMMVSLLLVLPPVNAGTRYFPNLRV